MAKKTRTGKVNYKGKEGSYTERASHTAKNKLHCKGAIYVKHRATAYCHYLRVSPRKYGFSRYIYDTRRPVATLDKQLFPPPASRSSRLLLLPRASQLCPPPCSFFCPSRPTAGPGSPPKREGPSTRISTRPPATLASPLRLPPPLRMPLSGARPKSTFR